MQPVTTTEHHKRFGKPAFGWAAAIVCALVTASCVFPPVLRRPDRHEWDDRQGPVIPHDTFPSDCGLCHAGGSWRQIRSDFHFDHGRETGVVLTGAHQNARCLRCHNDRGPVSAFARRGCAGCHEDVHRGQLGRQCNDCHSEDNWVPHGQIARHNRTRFPLVGAHAAVACFRCHPGAQVGQFLRATVACEACHQDDLARATSPNHHAQQWTQDCDRCHQPITWSGAGFRHDRFPLTGAHQTTDCTACHGNGTFGPLPTSCDACHLAEFQSTRQPDHVASNFSTDCRQCHNTVSWKGARFNHTGITSGCDQCHLPDYNGTTNPNHVTGNFPTSCEQCHNTTSWLGATFNHTGITNGCAQCHLPDYNGTTNPGHTAAGFPTSCETCHGTNTWLGAVFQHTFIITSGPHAKYTCTECHQVPNNYQIASCTHCHAHTQSKMDSKHQGRPGYSWTSSACINCHPLGKK